MHSPSQPVFSHAELLLKNLQTKLPENATVASLLAQWYLMRMNRAHGWKLSSTWDFRNNAFRYVEDALAINPHHSHANTIMGSLEARLNNSFDKAIDHHETALRSNPNNSLNHCFKASACTYQDDIGKNREAVFHANEAIRLSPLDPQLYLFKTVAAAANHYAGELENARKFATDSYTMNPNHTSNIRTLISVLVDLNEFSEAARLKDKLMQLDPTFSVNAYRKYGPGIKSRFANHIATNLEKTGVPLN